jgi:hypothetical protein
MGGPSTTPDVTVKCIQNFLQSGNTEVNPVTKALMNITRFETLASSV